MESIVSDRRPSEIVRGYLEAEFNNPNVLSGTRLPSINALAKQLKVSSSTVQAVLGEMAQEGVVRSVRGKGVFLVKEDAEEEGVKVVLINVASSEMTPENIWSGLISLGVMEALSRSGRTLLRPAQRVVDAPAGESESVEEECRECDGAILFARGGSNLYREAFEKAGKPVVFISPPAVNATRNFVSTDFYGNANRLAQTWAATGRKRVALVLHSIPNAKAVASMQVLMGFQAALAGSSEVAFHYVVEEGVGEVDVAGLLSCCEEKLGGQPDAYYFFNPVLAEKVIDQLAHRGVAVGEDVSIVAGTSHERLPDRKIQLSVFAQSLNQLGAEAAQMLAWRLEHGGQAAAGFYVPCHYIAGETTRAVENEYLKELISALG